MRRIPRRTWGYVGGGVVFVLLLVFAFRPAALPVQLAIVDSGEVEVALSEEGRTRAVGLLTVTAPIAGIVDVGRLEEGRAVRAGDVVGRMQPLPLDTRTITTLRAQLSAATSAVSGGHAELTAARLQAAQAKRDAARITRLEHEGAMSARDREAADLAVQSADEGVRARSAALAVARSNRAAAQAALLAAQTASASTATPIVSEVSGTIVRVYSRSARVVAAGTPLMEIAPSGDLELAVDVLSTDAVRIRPGMEVRVTGTGLDSLLAGRVRLVEPAANTKLSALGIEEQRVRVAVGGVRWPKGVGEGFKAEAHIILFRESVRVRIPSSALRLGADGPSVVIVRGGRASSVAVRIGRRGQRASEVLGGVDLGDTVVVYPSDEMTDGRRVRSERKRP